MALEERNGNYYYYKKEREGNRVFSKYYGKGELADLIAQMDEIKRYEKEIEAEKRNKNLRKLEEIDTEIDLFESKVKELTAQTLLSLGFYKTKSREWRLKQNEN
jgi:hypothetical protein